MKNSLSSVLQSKGLWLTQVHLEEEMGMVVAMVYLVNIFIWDNYPFHDLRTDHKCKYCTFSIIIDHRLILVNLITRR